MLRNLPPCSFASFLIVWLTPFINKPNSIRDLTIFMISPISSFKIIIINIIKIINIINVCTLWWCYWMLLANDLSTFFIKGKPIFSNGPKSPPRNPPDCTVLETCSKTVQSGSSR